MKNRKSHTRSGRDEVSSTDGFLSIFSSQMTIRWQTRDAQRGKTTVSLKTEDVLLSLSPVVRNHNNNNHNNNSNNNNNNRATTMAVTRATAARTIRQGPHQVFDRVDELHHEAVRVGADYSVVVEGNGAQVDVRDDLCLARRVSLEKNVGERKKNKNKYKK